jgi:hypothetical protein
MSRRCRGCLIGAALTIELGLGRPVAASDAMPSVLLYLANEAGVSSDIVGDARQEVIRIYAQIGVRVIWAEPATGSPKDRLVIIIPPITGQWVGPTGAFGLAVRGANSSGCLAYVFYDRVQPLAKKHQMSDASLLGAAIAHEIGHLLLPDGSHSPSGLMQGKWDNRQFSLARARLLRFTAQQAELIRTHLMDTQDWPSRNDADDRARPPATHSLSEHWRLWRRAQHRLKSPAPQGRVRG